MNIRQTFVIHTRRPVCALLGALSIAAPSRHGRCVFKCPNRAAQGVPEVMYACEVGDLDSATADLPLQKRGYPTNVCFHVGNGEDLTHNEKKVECFRRLHAPRA